MARLSELSPDKAEQLRAYNKDYWSRYYAANKDRMSAKAKADRSASPDSINKHRMKKYGISQDQYEALLFLQGGVCAICKKPEMNPRFSCLSVDHDHRTNKVRGLLCLSCNMAIGKLGDNVETLLSAVDYLRSHSEHS